MIVSLLKRKALFGECLTHKPMYEESISNKGKEGMKRGLIVFLLLFFFAAAVDSQERSVNWLRVARLKPDLKVLVLVEGDQAISLRDLSVLAEHGMVPADRDPGLVVGLRRAVFYTTLRKWMAGPSLPSHIKGKLLEQFIMSGIYRVGFKVEKEGYAGPLSLEVTVPRDGFGKRLLFSESLVRPVAPSRIHVDLAGNRWFSVDYPEIRYGQTIKFFSAFRYRVDMVSLLDHDLMLSEQVGDAPLPEEVLPFLNSGYKIDIRLPQATAWAAKRKPGPLNVRAEYKRLTTFLKETVAYDKDKKNRYFGGKSVYSDPDEMYYDPTETLSHRLGACPDTTLLECAFLRASSIPCRITGRFGHFFTVVYVPGSGWMSTSVTPTGIPLFLAPGPDHIPYQNWKPHLPLRTTLLEARYRIETLED
jgi:hypothetical protein